MPIMPQAGFHQTTYLAEGQHLGKRGAFVWGGVLHQNLLSGPILQIRIIFLALEPEFETTTYLLTFIY